MQTCSDFRIQQRKIACQGRGLSAAEQAAERHRRIREDPSGRATRSCHPQYRGRHLLPARAEREGDRALPRRRRVLCHRRLHPEVDRDVQEDHQAGPQWSGDHGEACRALPQAGSGQRRALHAAAGRRGLHPQRPVQGDFAAAQAAGSVRSGKRAGDHPHRRPHDPERPEKRSQGDALPDRLHARSTATRWSPRKKILDRLIALDRANLRAQELRAQVTFELGDTDKAAELYEAIPDLDSRPDGAAQSSCRLPEAGKAGRGPAHQPQAGHRAS